MTDGMGIDRQWQEHVDREEKGRAERELRVHVAGVMVVLDSGITDEDYVNAGFGSAADVLTGDDWQRVVERCAQRLLWTAGMSTYHAEYAGSEPIAR